MTGTLIASTPKSSMHALAYQGITASSCYAQIRDMLLRKFGDEYMLLFARPAENTGNGEIDWYSPVQGPVRKLSDLPEEERRPIEQTLLNMANEIHAYAEELIHSDDRLKITRGNILRLALSYPDRNALYVVGEQPVFTCWGFGPGTPGVEPENLWRLAPASAGKIQKPAEQQESPPRSGVPATPISAGQGCLWWLLPLLLLLLLFCLLCGAFGNVPALSGHALFSVPGFGFPGPEGREQKKIESLSGEIDQLKSRLKSHMALCLPKSGKVDGELPQEARKGNALPSMPKLVIPEHADDAGFMEGRWLCETGLASSMTNEPIKVYIRFGSDGKGNAITYEKNDKCVGDASASMQGSILRIEVGASTCEKSGHRYNAVSIDCRNVVGNQTECYGHYADGNNWSANFVRVE